MAKGERGAAERYGLGWTLASVFALVLVANPSAAQAPRILIGAVTESVVSRTDSTQRYALYVPSTYDHGRRWPVALLMDPRGRAMIPLERMTAVAERLGYVLISSYNTRSDEVVDLNAPAVSAMITDAQAYFSVDPERLYLVGFSGTARISWSIAEQLADNVAGVIAFGAGFPTPLYNLFWSSGEEPRFGYFGGTGVTDFNYDEVMELDWTLDEHDVPHKIEFFAGPHAWPRTPVFERALEWMELSAMRRGLRERDTVLIDELYAKRARVVDSLATVPGAYAAFVEHRAIADDFEGLVDVSPHERHSDSLAATEAVRGHEEKLRRHVAAHQAAADVRTRFMQSVRDEARAPELGDAVRQLDLERWKERAADSSDPESAAAAQRVLESIFVSASFYEHRVYVEEGAFDIAVALQRIANEIKPDDPRVCAGLAQGYAQLGEHDPAFDALECLAGAGALTADQLEGSTLLRPLRADPRFTALLDLLR